MHLTYSELEDFFMDLHGVAAAKRTALRGRLKHFQRLGWPAGTNKGKGARVQYGIGQTMLLAMGLEMLQLGLTPERVVDQMRWSGPMFARGFSEVLDEYGPEPDTIFYIFSPEALHGLHGEVESDGMKAMMVSRDQLHNVLSPSSPLNHWRRFAFINMTDLLERYINYFISRGLGAPERLREPLQNWVTLEGEALDRYHATMIRRYTDGDT